MHRDEFLQPLNPAPASRSETQALTVLALTEEDRSGKDLQRVPKDKTNLRFPSPPLMANTRPAAGAHRRIPPRPAGQPSAACAAPARDPLPERIYERREPTQPVGLHFFPQHTLPVSCTPSQPVPGADRRPITAQRPPSRYLSVAAHPPGRALNETPRELRFLQRRHRPEP